MWKKTARHGKKKTATRRYCVFVRTLSRKVQLCVERMQSEKFSSQINKSLPHTCSHEALRVMLIVKVLQHLSVSTHPTEPVPYFKLTSPDTKWIRRKIFYSLAWNVIKPPWTVLWWIYSFHLNPNNSELKKMFLCIGHLSLWHVVMCVITLHTFYELSTSV